MTRPVLYVIATGARATGDLPVILPKLLDLGWQCCVTLTPDATNFVESAPLEELTGYPVRSVYKQPDEPDVHPLADAYLVAPLTFNSLNRWADGHSDTLALGLLNEALGREKSIVAVPWINRALAKHPAVPGNLERLTKAGVQFVFDHGLLPEVRAGQEKTRTFPWDAVLTKMMRNQSGSAGDAR